MSNIFITDIVGSIGIPSNDTQLASATSTFDSILSGVANLTYDRVLGWVEDQAGPGGAEGTRTLNCMVEKFTYLTQECPSETQVDTLGAAIETALEADPSITTIDEQQYHLFQTGAYFLWQRDAAGGFLYPATTTDDVAVGGHVSPAGKWFDDGDLVLGTDVMSGTERLRVVDGGARIEKSDSSAGNALFVQVSGSHPAAQQAALLDVDVNSIGLDIDSEASSKALVNLQPLVTNTRGDIAFGTVRTSNPVSPNEGDVWYNATNHCLTYYDGTYDRCLNSQGLLAGASGVYYDGNNDYARISGTGWTVVGSCYFPGTNVATPSLFRAILSRAGTTGSIDVRLYDFTNAQEIGRVTVTASGKAVYSDTTLANLPAAGAIFEVQVMKSSGGASNGYLHYWEFY